MKKKSVLYEETLNEEELADLNQKLVSFWSSVVEKYPHKSNVNTLAKYRLRVEGA